MALAVKYLAEFSSGSLCHHISPECFLCVPTALAAAGRRRLEASGGRGSPQTCCPPAVVHNCLHRKFTLGILEAMGTRVHYIMSFSSRCPCSPSGTRVPSGPQSQLEVHQHCLIVASPPPLTPKERGGPPQLAIPEPDPQLLHQPPPPRSHLVTALSVLWLRTPAPVTMKAGLNSLPSPALCFAK